MRRFDRRAFLKAAAALPFAGRAALARAAESPPGRRLLVLVELKGGNDGLNTVVPFADPEYARLRPRLAVAREQLVHLSEHAGLHPSLAPLRPLWEAKQLAVVQGVGYPGANLSHFRSIEIWDTASRSDEYLAAGWLTRAFERSPRPPELAADGVVVGRGGMGPLAGPGVRAISLANPEQFTRNARLARAQGESANPALAHVLRVEREIVRAAERLHSGMAFKAAFPPGAFGNAVGTASQLAANPSGVAVVRLTLDGFDTHANQPGVHANLLRQLGEGLAALREALEEIGRWDATVVATYSEFGRRARENQSGGTDHGTAAPHFVLGGRVAGGLYGEPPALGRLDGNGNLPYAVDFRAYYATFLRRWWGIDPAPVLGAGHAPLAFLA
ncbi:MAG TPA: DUF1501 domain-containing protein [Usitatibacter sp.]|nr:DUF1501 domain-containing protein [Usitatibacter sp.]